MGLARMLERGGARLAGKEPAALELLQGDVDYNRMMLVVGPLWAIAVLGGTFLSTILNGEEVPSFHRVAVFVVIGTALLFSVVPLALWARRESGLGVAFVIPGLLGGILAGILIALAGPLHQETASFLPAYAAASFLFTTRRSAYLMTGTSLGSYVVAVLAVSGFVDPVTRIGVVTTLTVTTSWVMGWTVAKLQRLAASERAGAAEVAALADELAQANQHLEERVAEQVEQIDSLGRLERFLSPQVAQAVLSSSNAALLEPHRRQIAVLFCDLRGFTAFTANADPEEVVDVLGGYYDAAGDLVRAHDATLGSFQGDGVMAYFNDPFPCEDPPGEAVAMAQELRHSLRALQLRWEAKGFHLGFGLGVAWGYATLGTFGFEGRSDYTALGTVVNLASRLCAQAGDGEILLDPRAHDAVSERVMAHPLEVELKGFRGPVHAYRL
jgi:class 3 adenylate cyclase